MPVEKIAVISITPAGFTLACRIADAWKKQGTAADVFAPGINETASLGDAVKKAWGAYEGLIMVMAAGIAVRVISPLLSSKWTDPAVVVIDEKGSFAVSLIGGHWGGSNNLARQAAALVEATPVITTATDVWGKPAVDLLAREWGLLPLPREKVKTVNKAILAGERVVLYTEWEFPYEFQNSVEVQFFSGSLTMTPAVKGSCYVFVTNRNNFECPDNSLFLCPASLVAGIGCKAGASRDEIKEALVTALFLTGRRKEGLSALATHEAKFGERGLQEIAEEMKLPLICYSSTELQKTLQEFPSLQYSSFVYSKMGVGGICEPAALASVPKGKIILPKTKVGKVTVALAEAGLLWSESDRVIRRI